MQISDENLQADSDLHVDAGVDVDDFDDMIIAFAEKFSVDMSGYLWYFHTGEEGTISIGSIFFPTPDSQVKRIPITSRMLCKIANQGKWNIIYPEHKIPKRRYDVIVNRIFTIATILLFLVMVSKKYGLKYGLW